MNKNTVGWYEIYVENMERAVTFYESVFQRKTERLETPTPDMKMQAITGDMNSYGAPGALVRMPGFSSGRNSVIVYFSCDDCSVEETRVLEFGGKIEKKKFAIGPYGFISLVYDTEGNMIGLHSMK